MLWKLTRFKIAPLASVCLIAFMPCACKRSEPVTEPLSKQELPLLQLAGKSTDVSAYQYLGSWQLPDDVKKTDRYSWRDAVRVEFANKREIIQIISNAPKLPGASRQLLTLGAEAGSYEKIAWRNNQVSILAFRALSPRKQVVLAEIDTDNSIALYVNEKLAREMSGSDNVEIGANLLIPMELESGENIIIAKVFSNGKAPRFRMSLVLDQSKDFQAAWNSAWGFLTNQIYNRSGNSVETPTVRWDPLLDRMTIKAVVSDALTGDTVITKESLRTNNPVRDGSKVLEEGIYKIFYVSNASQRENASEYFLVGSPKKIYDTITHSLEGLPWDADEHLNVEAQLRRAKILFDKANYDSQNKQWREKVLYTLGSLAEYVRLKRENTGNVFKNLPGLHLRGFISKIDNSKQFYRLYAPSNCQAAGKLPLLIIIPTVISVAERSFLESPFLAYQQMVVQVSKFAEKFGFVVLWSGYRNAPAGWTCESVHAEEALEDVERNYNIDKTRISLYGICSAGIFAGRMASIYPTRFAAIVYDRAIYEDNPANYNGAPDSIKEWIKASNPVERILGNTNLRILVLHDGTTVEGHGDIELTRKFLNGALPKKPDITYTLGQRQMGVGLWNSIFEFLGNCKNKHPDNTKVDIPAASGYAGPISEVFATPFIVVEGTKGLDRDGEYLMFRAINKLKTQYHDHFYDADFVLKKDIEVTDEEIEKYSLVLVGNVKSNIIWNKLAARANAS